ncbi:SMP-30/gluconolactonase/LRE family protein [Telluria aromaticivorans]|uniref:SMP-30/Gluconolactonase/LRE-like region domain-containing protein n=1 Tax=Telluria aromaticivorans TaxID=2725995 RepID=A0A7Y2K340_9BURK|nr:SMP-30/gluconolactonase/LRE family protein [Telluria aromaticivorans]NNG25712.1 hypothetical protein [Telluria aromaticivorans]
MKKQDMAKAARMRLKVVGASALIVLLAACGDHPPKDDGDGEEPPPVRSTGISIVAGNATESGARDATGTAARFNAPRGIAMDGAGNLYVVDGDNDTIRKITPSGAVTTFAGFAGGEEYIDGVGGSARFTNPYAIAIDRSGTLFVTDELRIRSIGTGGQVSTVTTIPVGTNVQGRSMGLVRPGGIAVDTKGSLYVTNSYGTRRIANGTTTMLEGSNVVNNLTNTQPFYPRGIAVDSNDNVYVADLQKTVSKTNGSTTLTHLAGTPGTTGSRDGTGTAASFERVVAMTVDPQGNVYAADEINNVVRKITPAGVVTTVAGTLKATTLTTGALPGSLPPINGITTDGKGNLYATTGNAVIKIAVP